MKRFDKVGSGIDLQARAHRAVSKAIETGELVRQPCEVCNNPRTEGHHEDYSKPLDVLWLCRRHHKQEHVKLRKIAGTPTVRWDGKIRKTIVGLRLSPASKKAAYKLAKDQHRTLSATIELLIMAATNEAEAKEAKG